MKQFPQLLGARHLEELTQEQETWLISQCLLDAGVAVCPSCEAIGTSRFCEQCGTPRHDETAPHQCPKCHQWGTGVYCGSCGTVLVHPTTQALDAGTFDWDTWEQALTPFMGSLSPQEQQYLDGQWPIGAFDGSPPLPEGRGL